MPQTITQIPESPPVRPGPSLSAVTSLPAATLARLIRRKQLSPVEVTDAYLTQIDRFNPAINAFSYVDAERARGAALEADAAQMRGGLCAGGIGSDGGGCIRVPASFCGIAGLNPTPGRIPGTGHYPACAGPFSLIGVVGPMARTVEDLQLLLDATSGYDAGDPVSFPNASAIHDERCADRLRIGFYEDDGYSSPTPEVRAAVRAAANALAAYGFEVEPLRPEGLVRVRELWFTIFVEAIAMVLKPMTLNREDEISDNTREFLALAAEQPPLTGERLLQTLLERDVRRVEVLAQMERFPILLAPVCAPFVRAQIGRAHV